MLYDASRAGICRPRSLIRCCSRAAARSSGKRRGRGTAWFLSVQSRAWVLRHYRRGGAVSALSRDRYWWSGEEDTRPFAEWQLTYHLHRAGLPVAAPIAARYRKQGFAYRGDIITERLPDVRSLAQALQDASLSLLTWIAVGRCLRRFHDAGVCHADLNAHNILLGQTDAPPRVYLIDFDRGTLRKPGFWQDANLVRLRRSLEKISWGPAA